MLAAFCVFSPWVALAQNSPADFGSDATRLKTGLFAYQDRNQDDGSVVGSSRIVIRRLGNESEYEFSNLATFTSGFLGFHSQRWTTVASKRFQPKSAALSFLNGSEVAPIFDIIYQAGKATGFVVSRSSNEAAKKSYVNDPIPADTVDQRIDWAAVIANDLEVGRHFEFNVYDPKGGISHVQADVGALIDVHVPAGDFVSYAIDYRIHKANGIEHFRVFASKESPRFMVREEFSNGVVTDLVRIENAAPSN
ncbi:hypothetical protein [Dyella sp. Tek66A03]|uniref:hypothetical protein n=1 Tax=Dyella sp. Tek66A03 TaxID=3458298 RepID=UPI00403EC5F2